uniref:Copia protein n=1 Tax=Tanacetum cinerariifolium TaxID=118510 RepID=A0A6L2LQ59_TANCI|nr:hypothetical protein [Tanacetum cinerariifolium]
MLGENVTQADTEEPPSHTEGEHAAMEEEPINAVLITTVKPTKIQPITTIISTSQPEPSIPQREGNAIATDDQPEVQRKLVPASKEEEAEKIGLDPKKITSVKAGKKFKKAQDAKHQYMWTMSNRLKPEPITDVKIHPNTKPAVLTVYRNNDKRNFEVHNPFKFGDFGITELDELGPIIKKKKNSIVKDLMTSLGKRKRKHMELEPEIKLPRLECNRSPPDCVPFVNNMVIEEPEYGIFFTDVFGDQAFQRWNDIHKVIVDSLVSYLVMVSMIKTQENDRFGLKLRKLIAEHPDQEKLQSKKVKLEALGYKLD